MKNKIRDLLKGRKFKDMRTDELGNILEILEDLSLSNKFASRIFDIGYRELLRRT